MSTIYINGKVGASHPKAYKKPAQEERSSHRVPPQPYYSRVIGLSISSCSSLLNTLFYCLWFFEDLLLKLHVCLPCISFLKCHNHLCHVRPVGVKPVCLVKGYCQLCQFCKGFAWVKIHLWAFLTIFNPMRSPDMLSPHYFGLFPFLHLFFYLSKIFWTNISYGLALVPTLTCSLRSSFLCLSLTFSFP